ncbi:COBRA, plant [Dillenia turbinata]|uniref:COBRA, plant n=1 Tax=Dillenia turbinata TaxID=194707 RepID=A0AAN8VU10_9MAGN
MFFTIITLITIFFTPSLSQNQNPPLITNLTCNEIFVSYRYDFGNQLPPNISTTPSKQPYRFQSTLTVLNNGLEELKSWKVYVGFSHNEYLVSASNAVLSDGTDLPANVSNTTIFAGFPVTDLKTAVETAGDLSQMKAEVVLIGTQFGVAPPDVPLPSTLALANYGYLCAGPAKNGNNELDICCTRDPNARSNVPVDGFLPRQSGDLTIMYDVIRTFDTNYWARVTISNHDPLSRLDNWQLKWEWMREEFINTMKGATTLLVDSSECIFGSQGRFYKDLDFSTVLNCEKTPTIIDLPLSSANDTNLGMIPFCCRNGSILPPSMDPTKSKSVFQLQVYKMPLDLNRTKLAPPQNWQISGTFNPDYQCGSPMPVSPSTFPDPSGLPRESAAVASWQIVCNVTQSKAVKPKCCVSFSAFYNSSVVPCPTCACGCNNTSNKVCSANTPALLLPSELLLVPFANRTEKALAFAKMTDQVIPSPLPCGDNCGVSINWHVQSDFTGGWTAKISILNWGDTSFADWFAAVKLDKAMAGFEKAYSFNASVLDGYDSTLFMQGLKDMNFLLGETEGKDPKKDLPHPGFQQSVISFTKKKTPGFDVVTGNGFPTKVYFNGEECALPSIHPNNGIQTSATNVFLSFFVAIVVLLSLQQ